MTGPITNAAEWILSGGQADAPAVLSGDEVVTYGRLRARAGRLCGQAAGRRAGSGRPRRPVPRERPGVRRGLPGGHARRPVRRAAADRREREDAGTHRGRHDARPHRGLRPAAAEIAAGWPPSWASACWSSRRTGLPRPPPAPPADRSAPRPGRHHVHFGLHRRAQGRHGHPRQHPLQYPRHHRLHGPAAGRPGDGRAAVLLLLRHLAAAHASCRRRLRRAQQPLHVPGKGARRSPAEAVHRPGRRPRDLPDPAPQDAFRRGGSFPRCAGCNRRAEACPTPSSASCAKRCRGSSSMSCTARPRRPRG